MLKTIVAAWRTFLRDRKQAQQHSALLDACEACREAKEDTYWAERHAENERYTLSEVKKLTDFADIGDLVEIFSYRYYVYSLTRHPPSYKLLAVVGGGSFYLHPGDLSYARNLSKEKAK